MNLLHILPTHVIPALSWNLYRFRVKHGMTLKKRFATSSMTFSVNLPGGLGKPPLSWTDAVKSGPEFPKFATVGTAVSALLPFVFILGGIIMGGMLIIGGFDILTSMGSEEKLKAGAERIKNALIGFLLLFGSYWLAQIAQVLFKIPIL